MADVDSEEIGAHVGEVGVSHLSKDGSGFLRIPWREAGKGVGSWLRGRRRCKLTSSGGRSGHPQSVD